MLRSVRGGGALSRAGVPSKCLNLLTELGRADISDEAAVNIVDQGVLQAIWSLEMLAERPIADALLTECRPWLPDRVCLVRTPVPRLKRQLRGRTDGRSRFDRLGDDELDAAIERGRERLETILELWRRSTPDACMSTLLNDANATERLYGTITRWRGALPAG